MSTLPDPIEATLRVLRDPERHRALAKSMSAAECAAVVAAADDELARRNPTLPRHRCRISWCGRLADPDRRYCRDHASEEEHR